MNWLSCLAIVAVLSLALGSVVGMIRAAATERAPDAAPGLAAQLEVATSDRQAAATGSGARAQLAPGLYR